MISEFPLFLFTTLVGLAAGGNAANVVCDLVLKRDAGKRGLVFAAVCLVLLAVSSLAVTAHLHHPERVLNAFSNLSSSLTQEGIAAMVLGVLFVADVAVRAKRKTACMPLRVVGAVAALVMVAVMAHAYFTVWGNAAWARVETLLFFVVCTLACGFALVAAVFGDVASDKRFAVAGCALQVLSAVAMAAEAAVFASVGFSPVPFAAGAVLSAVAAAAAAVSAAKPQVAGVSGKVALVACLIGLLVARYAFYATGLYVL